MMNSLLLVNFNGSSIMSSFNKTFLTPGKNIESDKTQCDFTKIIFRHVKNFNVD